MLEFTIISEECLQNNGGGTLWVVIGSSVFMLRSSHPVTYMRPAYHTIPYIWDQQYSTDWAWQNLHKKQISKSEQIFQSKSTYCSWETPHCKPSLSLMSYLAASVTGRTIQWISASHTLCTIWWVCSFSDWLHQPMNISITHIVRTIWEFYTQSRNHLGSDVSIISLYISVKIFLLLIQIKATSS